MTWYIRIGEQIIGTVIAATAAEAIELAYQKFQVDIEAGELTVEARQR